ncbi:MULTISPECIES: hypothetical protein [Variovorax]|uniref:hypothetical protein n=1 Tax=Variovorax TaxID=34072 RepID=UPI001644287E|nr:hypothetical protein [Variovorax paradoxus]MDR6522271.1 hypothetical protein [Variovorax paradoxus]
MHHRANVVAGIPVPVAVQIADARTAPCDLIGEITPGGAHRIVRAEFADLARHFHQLNLYFHQVLTGPALEGQASIERSDAVASVALFGVPESVGRRRAQLEDIESEFLQGRIQRVANMMISAFVASFTNSPAGSRTRFSLSALQLLKWSAAISSAGRPPTTRYNAMPWDCKSS